MIYLSRAEGQILKVSNFLELVSTNFQGKVNALCWERELIGDFSEIVKKVELRGNITEIDLEELNALVLSEQGELAREILVNDMALLETYGASPTLNVIKMYERDDINTIFPTDVYSYHVDRSPIPTDTFLCTYVGEPSEIIPNSQVIQKILVPEIREALQEEFTGDDGEFEDFIREHFYDLHYQANPAAQPTSLGHGHLWRLAIDHPQSNVPPCIHRAPVEKSEEYRLLLIC